MPVHWGLVNAAMRGALAGIPLTQLARVGAPAPRELA